MSRVSGPESPLPLSSSDGAASGLSFTPDSLRAVLFTLQAVVLLKSSLQPDFFGHMCLYAALHFMPILIVFLYF